MKAPRLVCPDCSATAEHTIEHDLTCPTLRRVEQVCATDAGWFANHPAARWRWRDADLAERAELELAGLDVAGMYVRVLVTDFGHGHHQRVFSASRRVLVIALDIPPAEGWAA